MKTSVALFVALSLVFFLLLAESAHTDETHYVVYMGDPPMAKERSLDLHLSYLTEIKQSDSVAKESLVYSYNYLFNGFAARLSQVEAMRLRDMDGVISVFPSKIHKLHTTKSWDSLGFPQTVKRSLPEENDVIIGIIDSDSKSFSGKGFGPPPAKWKGTCPSALNFTGCNNKLVGARFFTSDPYDAVFDILSPIDRQGHGTHVFSIVAGNLVPKEKFFGLLKGTARGAVPSARIAMYKACYRGPDGGACRDANILAAFDAAVHDGVDIISISVGNSGINNYLSSSISIGSYHAMKMGILTIASAGNEGGLGTVENHAPWILTVAASADRIFKNRMRLGDGRDFLGLGVDVVSPKKKAYPLITGAAVAIKPKYAIYARACLRNSLNVNKIKGKIVYCESGDVEVDNLVIKEYGAFGAITETADDWNVARVYMTPSTMVNSTLGQIISEYANSTGSLASAVIFKSHAYNVRTPFVTSFSSRGPNPGSRRVLKPDVSAPGANILGAFSPLASLTGQIDNEERSRYALLSGTSQACPHVTGIAAYVKSFHPTWSPAAIKSAILTTAIPMGNKDREFAYGAGLVDPVQSVNPGLVYDMYESSYIDFLCSEGYNISSCSGRPSVSGMDGLNYPTIQLAINEGKL